MRVIFTKEVSGVAHSNEVHEVADGFALNYLFPHGLAVPATPEKIKALAQQKESASKHQARQQGKAQGLATELNGKTVVIERPAASTGTLYAAISAEMVAEAIKQQLKISLLAKQIDVPHQAKTVGLHKVKVNLSSQIIAYINLQINAKT